MSSSDSSSRNATCPLRLFLPSPRLRNGARNRFLARSARVAVLDGACARRIMQAACNAETLVDDLTGLTRPVLSTSSSRTSDNSLPNPSATSSMSSSAESMSRESKLNDLGELPLASVCTTILAHRELSALTPLSKLPSPLSLSLPLNALPLPLAESLLRELLSESELELPLDAAFLRAAVGFVPLLAVRAARVPSVSSSELLPAPCICISSALAAAFSGHGPSSLTTCTIDFLAAPGVGSSVAGAIARVSAIFFTVFSWLIFLRWASERRSNQRSPENMSTAKPTSIAKTRVHVETSPFGGGGGNGGGAGEVIASPSMVRSIRGGRGGGGGLGGGEAACDASHASIALNWYCGGGGGGGGGAWQQQLIDLIPVTAPVPVMVKAFSGLGSSAMPSECAVTVSTRVPPSSGSIRDSRTGCSYSFSPSNAMTTVTPGSQRGSETATCQGSAQPICGSGSGA
eukprot:scaffold282229_cov24-Tisochrysis_lutea.AAC.1